MDYFVWQFFKIFLKYQLIDWVNIQKIIQQKNV